MLAMLEAGPEILSVTKLAISRQDPGAAANITESLRADLVVEAIGRNSVAAVSRGRQ
jgi:hypothetical protein